MADQGNESKRASGSAYADSLEASGLRRSQEKLPGAGAGTPQLPDPGSVIDGKYRVEQLLAQGGMGAVYSASHVVSGKRVALKWMLPSLSQSADSSERFIREARATARIDHPNVVDVYDVGHDGASVYLVMEFLSGETLHARMTRARIAPGHAVALLMPALRGVAEAHSHGVIHRDLKPDNIFLCQGAHGEPREPKVLDFGISKIANSEHVRDQGLTQTGVVMGTPYYMSPEQVRGVREVDARGDVYAFGVILYELLAGQRPFQAETYNQLILKIATEDPRPIAELNPDVAPQLIAVVQRAMAREPEARWASVEALGLALEPFAAGTTFHLVSSVPGELGAPRPSSATATPTPGSTPRVVPTPQHAPNVRQPVKPARDAGMRGWLLVGLLIGLVLGGAVLWRVRGLETAKPEHVVTPLATTDTTTATAAAALMPPTAATSAQPAQAQLPVAQEPPAAVEATSASAAPRSKREKQRAEPTSASAQALAADWDERLPTGVAPGAAGSGKQPVSAAGPLSADDLR